MPLLRPRVVAPDKPRPGMMPVGVSPRDSFLQSIVKWIPIEVLGAYQFAVGLLPPHHPFRFWFSAGAIVVCGLWIAFATRPADRPVAWRQVLLSPFAFACWVAAMEVDLLRDIDGRWEAWMGSVTLAFGTLLLPILDGVLMRMGIRQGGP